MLFTVFNNSHEESVPFSVSDKCIISQALVTEKPVHFSLSSLHLINFLFFVSRLFSVSDFFFF